MHHHHLPACPPGTSEHPLLYCPLLLRLLLLLFEVLFEVFETAVLLPLY